MFKLVLAVYSNLTALHPSVTELDNSCDEESDIWNLDQEQGQIEENKRRKFLVVVKETFSLSEIWFEFCWNYLNELYDDRNDDDDERHADGVDGVDGQPSPLGVVGGAGSHLSAVD